MFRFNKILFLILIFYLKIVLVAKLGMWKRGITELVQCFCSRLQFHGFASTNMQSCVLWQKSVSVCVFLKTDAGFLLSFQGRNEIESCEKSESRMCSSICLFARINTIFHISTLNIAIRNENRLCTYIYRFWSKMIQNLYNIIRNLWQTKIDYAPCTSRGVH